MTTRLDVTKTYKLYINGAFARSESGRTALVRNEDWSVRAHVCSASRKDLRDAVRAAASAQREWGARTAYNRAQILYRIAEMLEGRAVEIEDEIASALLLRPDGPAPATDSKAQAALRTHTRERARRQVVTAIDRFVAFAGWCDKFQHVLGCRNAVAGPYHNFTMPEPTGVVAVIAPERPSFIGLVTLLAPALCAGNAAVAIASDAEPVSACLLAEVCQTSDVPPGVANILTGDRAELTPWIASHREVNAIHAAHADDESARTLRLGAAENLKRVSIRRFDPEPPLDADGEGWYAEACESPEWIEPFTEAKTIWHPSSA